MADLRFNSAFRWGLRAFRPEMKTRHGGRVGRVLRLHGDLIQCVFSD